MTLSEKIQSLGYDSMDDFIEQVKPKKYSLDSLKSYSCRRRMPGLRVAVKLADDLNITMNELYEILEG